MSFCQKKLALQPKRINFDCLAYDFYIYRQCTVNGIEQLVRKFDRSVFFMEGLAFLTFPIREIYRKKITCFIEKTVIKLFFFICQNEQKKIKQNKKQHQRMKSENV